MFYHFAMLSLSQYLSLEIHDGVEKNFCGGQ